MTNFEIAMLSFLQDAQNEFNSEKEVEHFIEKHAPKLMEAAHKQLMTEIWHKESGCKMRVYLFHDNDDGELITDLWATSVPDIGEQMILWDKGEHHHYDVTQRIYGANAEEKVGVWNLYVKPKRKGFID